MAASPSAFVGSSYMSYSVVPQQAQEIEVVTINPTDLRKQEEEEFSVIGKMLQACEG